MPRDFKTDIEIPFFCFPVIERIMLWVHQRIRAHLPGQRERTGADIGTYHFRRAQRFYRANNQTADRANAGDKDAFALQIARLMSRMNGNRQRLGKGHGFFVRLFRRGMH